MQKIRLRNGTGEAVNHPIKKDKSRQNNAGTDHGQWLKMARKSRQDAAHTLRSNMRTINK